MTGLTATPGVRLGAASVIARLLQGPETTRIRDTEEPLISTS